MDWNIPSTPPPPGVTSNFTNPESKGYESLITTIICLSLVAPVFALRLYSKAFVTRSFGWDDYTCALGVIGAVAYAGLFLNMLNYGYGLHGWDVLFTRYEGGLKYLLPYTLIYGPTMFFIKTSVLLLYRKIFGPEPHMRTLVYVGIGYLFITNAVATVIFGALCAPRPGERYLTRYSKPECFNNVDNLAIAIAVENLIADVFLLVLPLPIIWKLQMSPKRKYALICLFMTGFLACLASLGSVILRSLYGHNPDYSYWSPRIAFTGIIEMNVSIICACMPACAAVFRHPFSDEYFRPLKSWFSRITTTISRSSSSKRSVGGSGDESSSIGEKKKKKYHGSDVMRPSEDRVIV